MINFALDLEPKKAKEWFATKHISTKNYRDITAAEHAKAFTVANITNLDMLNDLKSSLDDALASGQGFSQWRRGVLVELKRKGWVQRVAGKTEIFDPETGEYFMGGHRLQRIYRTNMQSAYSAQQYQNYIANVDNRPYWRYDAISDNRTRPAHSALNGLVYRYDDPFWSSHYPPNGYQCRCSVTALAERDIKRSNITVAKTADDDVITVDKVINKNGDTVPVNAVRMGDKVSAPDVGFDYNIGRMNYRPQLDDYDADLAHQFCISEMSGRDFAYNFARINNSAEIVKKRMGFANEKLITREHQLAVQNALDTSNTYAAGMLSESVSKLIQSRSNTVWISDNTLAKQYNSRYNQDFGLLEYENLPDIIHNPDYVLPDPKFLGKGFWLLFKEKRIVILKVLEDATYLQTYYPVGLDKKDKVVRQLKKKGFDFTSIGWDADPQ